MSFEESKILNNFHRTHQFDDSRSYEWF